MNISREEFAAYEIEKAAFIVKRNEHDWLLGNLTVNLSGDSNETLGELITS